MRRKSNKQNQGVKHRALVLLYLTLIKSKHQKKTLQHVSRKNQNKRKTFKPKNSKNLH